MGGGSQLGEPERATGRPAAHVTRSASEKLTDHISAMSLFNGQSLPDLRAAVETAVARRDTFAVPLHIELARLAILAVHERQHPTLAKWMARVEEETGWTFDQRARMSQRKGAG